jgi:hypothetical protein
LISILPDINFQASGVGGKPTVQLSGVNLQLINGSGSEFTVNGEGNLVIGYNPSPGPQTGSHNLVLGTSGQGYGGYGGIEAGFKNSISGSGGSVLGGDSNRAVGLGAVVIAGQGNEARGQDSWVGGGSTNLAAGLDSAVTGGFQNNANGFFSEAAGSSPYAIPLNFLNWGGEVCCGARAPEWYTDGSGIVHLQGAVRQSSTEGQANLIGTLPLEARPTHNVFTIVHTGSGTYADLAIDTDGTINLLPSFNTNTTFVSLEGISYRQ